MSLHQSFVAFSQRPLTLLLLLLSPAIVATAAEAPSLSLEQCVAESLAANRGLASLAYQRDAAMARATAAAAARRPTLDLVGLASHATDPLRLRPARFGDDPGTYSRDVWQAGLGFSMPIYAGGRLQAEAEAARLLADAAAGDAAFARQSLAVQVVALYHEAIAAQALIDSLVHSRASLQAQMDRIDALIRQQKAAGVDQMRVAVRLARLEQDIADAGSRKANLQATISVLMGRDAGTPWELDPASTTSTEAVPLGMLAPPGARADEQAARMRLDSAIEAEKAARAGRRPTVTANLAWGPRGDFGGESYESGVAILSFRVPLVDSGRARALLSEAHSRRQASERAAEQVALDRGLEVNVAAVALRSAQTRVAATRSVVEQALESLRIVQLKYELGDGTIVDVLDAQAASDEAAALRARAFADLAIATAARDLALGHVFKQSAATPALRLDLARSVSPSSGTP